MVEKGLFPICLNVAFSKLFFIHPVDHGQVGRHKRDMLQFRQELVDQLIGRFCSRQRISRPRNVGTSASIHLLAKITVEKKRQGFIQDFRVGGNKMRA